MWPVLQPHVKLCLPNGPLPRTVGDDLPELGTDLVAALATLDVNLSSIEHRGAVWGAAGEGEGNCQRRPAAAAMRAQACSTGQTRTISRMVDAGWAWNTQQMCWGGQENDGAGEYLAGNGKWQCGRKASIDRACGVKAEGAMRGAFPQRFMQTGVHCTRQVDACHSGVPIPQPVHSARREGAYSDLSFLSSPMWVFFSASVWKRP